MPCSPPDLLECFPESWRALAGDLLTDHRFQRLAEQVAAERGAYPVYPTREDVFAAFTATPPESVRAVILGQDPYHGAGQAHGLCFSVPPGRQLPPSLRNIFKELSSDLGCAPPTSGDLRSWANQGVLLLNSILTVRSAEPLSHRGIGWEWFTDQVIERLARRTETIVFLLWGGPAQKKQGLIAAHQPVLTAAHPSPLSAYRGFFGSRPFSRCNAALVAGSRPPIHWCPAPALEEESA